MKEKDVRKMSVVFVLNVILILLTIINLVFHSTGIFLLRRLKKNGGESVQNIYIQNLSISELVLNLAVMVDRFSKLFPRSAKVADILSIIHYYLLILVFTGIVLVYYLIMFYITSDKMLEVLLNLKYTVYWGENKAKQLMTLTWVVGLVMGLGFSLAYALKGYHFENILLCFCVSHP